MTTLSSEALKRLWVCEWHPCAGLGVISLGDVVERNSRSIMRKGKGTGHEVLAVFASMDDALDHNRMLKSFWREAGRGEGAPAPPKPYPGRSVRLWCPDCQRETPHDVSGSTVAECRACLEPHGMTADEIIKANAPLERSERSGDTLGGVVGP